MQKPVQQAEAKLAAQKLEAEEKKQTRNLKSHFFFKDIFLEYEEEYSKHLKPSTVYRKSIDFNKWILPHFGNKRLKDITKKECQKFIDFMSTQLKSYKPIIIQARNVFDFAVQNDYIEMSPFNNTVYPKVTLFEEKEKLENFWNKNQSIYFLEQVKNNDTLKNTLYFVLYCLQACVKGNF